MKIYLPTTPALYLLPRGIFCFQFLNYLSKGSHLYQQIEVPSAHFSAPSLLHFSMYLRDYSTSNIEIHLIYFHGCLTLHSCLPLLNPTGVPALLLLRYMSH